ncbi:hypothetical protein AAHA92_07211 [Salvia divinorum]|uniref:Uncharacterized protein n=1 Tax=Salvia divinorum TaxID=28513 RepID=A0ABD1I983_SALDI
MDSSTNCLHSIFVEWKSIDHVERSKHGICTLLQSDLTILNAKKVVGCQIRPFQTWACAFAVKAEYGS